MAALVSNIKEILSIEIKLRHDSYSDQYSRIFMVKIFLIGTLFMGLNWYHDKITCMIPDSIGISKNYVADACWIQGFYVYEDVKAEKDTVAYDGIPTNLDFDGRYENGKLCIADTPRKVIDDDECISMKKVFYLQYQYMPFLIATLSLLHYLPYIGFKIVNSDMIDLKDFVRTSNNEIIMHQYFNPTVNSRLKMRVRVLINFVIKLLYAVVNISGFLLINTILNGRYITFGTTWASWANLANHIAHDYMGKRDNPKPGNMLLPTFGICEIFEGARDIRSTITNKHKFICEYSQHILYHYVLLVFWFMSVCGIFISCIGLLLHIIDFLIAASCFLKEPRRTKELQQFLSFREYEYLEYIRRKNLVMYGEIKDKLSYQRIQDGNNNHEKIYTKVNETTTNGFIPKPV